jgi:hypothetical protein
MFLMAQNSATNTVSSFKAQHFVFAGLSKTYKLQEKPTADPPPPQIGDLVVQKNSFFHFYCLIETILPFFLDPDPPTLLNPGTQHCFTDDISTGLSPRLLPIQPILARGGLSSVYNIIAVPGILRGGEVRLSGQDGPALAQGENRTGTTTGKAHSSSLHSVRCSSSDNGWGANSL